MYRRLYQDGVVIVEDFFDPLPSNAAALPSSVPSNAAALPALVPSNAAALPSSCRPALFTCTEEQAEYVTKAGIRRDVIFDGVVRSCITQGYDTIIGVQDAKKKSKEVKGPVERQQLRACRSNYEYMKQYEYQMELLLENIFPKKLAKNKGDPANWMFKMTNIVGGLHYQHPHADQGWGLEYDGEAT